MVFGREKIGECLFFAALIIILFVDYVSATYVSLIISGRLIQASIVLLGVKLLLTHYSWKEWGAIGVLLFLGGVSFLQTRNYFAWELFLLIAASKGIDKRKVMQCFLYVVGTITLLAALASIAGIFGEVSQLKNFRGPRGAEPELRYCFGYVHPNTCHIVYMQLLLAVIWLYYSKMKWYVLLFFAAFNLILGLFTDSRTGMLLGLLVFLFLAVEKKWEEALPQKVLYWLNIAVFIGALGLSVLAVKVGIKNSVLELISKLWTGRIEYANLEAAKSQITLFSGADYQITCDMGFVKMFYDYGVVIFGILLVFMFCRIILNIKEKNIVEMMIIFTGLIFFMGETFSSGEFITRNILMVLLIGMWPQSIDCKAKSTAKN